MDMAALALNPNEVLTLTAARWNRVAGVAAMTLEAARPGYRRVVVAGLPAVTDGTDVIILTHPLWRTDRALGLSPELDAAWNEAERMHGFRVDPQDSFISVFEALRRPA
jgi:hypothetical protein